MIVSTALFFIGELFPYKKYETNGLIEKLTMHTLGVYCMHYLLGNVLDIVFERFELTINRFLLCILIYIVAYILAHIIYILPWKETKQLVD